MNRNISKHGEIVIVHDSALLLPSNVAPAARKFCLLLLQYSLLTLENKNCLFSVVICGLVIEILLSFFY